MTICINISHTFPLFNLSCRFNRAPREWNTGPTREDIRRTERGLLDAWTNETFSQLSIAVVVLLFLATVVAAGPPPTDARCTLPWC